MFYSQEILGKPADWLGKAVAANEMSIRWCGRVELAERAGNFAWDCGDSFRF